MEHLYPGLIEPVTEVIENLISLPSRYRKQSKRSTAAMLNPEEENGDKPFSDDEMPQGSMEAESLPQSTLSRKKRLSKKEEALAAYERSLVSRAAKLASDELAFHERRDACRIHRIPTVEISASPFQPRRTFDDLSLYSLSESIRKHGILQPLTVRRLPDVSGAPAPMYELICGERRLRAAEAIGMEEVPCILLDCVDSRCAELALIENLQRENLDPFEAAAAIAALIDMHAMTQEEIAKSLSVSQSYVANKLRILRLTEPEREWILAYHLTERHARTFLRLKSLEDRFAAIKYVAEHHLTVAQTEAYIERLLGDETLEHTPSDAVTDAEKKGRRTLIIKDVRLFFNTVDRAVSTMREAGIPVESTRVEEDGEITVRITVPSSSAARRAKHEDTEEASQTSA